MLYIIKASNNAQCKNQLFFVKKNKKILEIP